MIETSKAGECLGFQHFDESVTTVDGRLALQGYQAAVHTAGTVAEVANGIVVFQIPKGIVVVVSVATADAAFRLMEPPLGMRVARGTLARSGAGESVRFLTGDAA
jgi:hypothetical protein